MKYDDTIFLCLVAVVAFLGYTGHDGAAGIIAGMAVSHKGAAIVDDKIKDNK